MNFSQTPTPKIPLSHFPFMAGPFQGRRLQLVYQKWLVNDNSYSALFSLVFDRFKVMRFTKFKTPL